jgi:hypothetical protein
MTCPTLWWLIKGIALEFLWGDYLVFGGVHAEISLSSSNPPILKDISYVYKRGITLTSSYRCGLDYLRKARVAQLLLDTLLELTP